ncbi:GIY-YIG nuclease family protein [Streptomyces albogriseolus]|uniref:GIY-YIG nuclease family protein n=1 Tax=Streptomyces albogriseolus TaxID=1887 RepID=UPI00382C84FE
MLGRLTMVTCCWTKDDAVCGASAEVRYSLPLCDEHLSGFYRGRTYTIRQSAAIHGVESFPGYCYVVLLPDETVKIGYSNTEETLKKRFRDLKREAEKDGPGFDVLAVMTGGCAMEAVLHYRFEKSRIPGLGERFEFSGEIQDFLATAPRLSLAV